MKLILKNSRIVFETKGDVDVADFTTPRYYVNPDSAKVSVVTTKNSVSVTNISKENNEVKLLLPTQIGKRYRMSYDIDNVPGSSHYIVGYNAGGGNTLIPVTYFTVTDKNLSVEFEVPEGCVNVVWGYVIKWNENSNHARNIKILEL